MISVGSPVPDFTFHATPDTQASLADFRGRHLVLYFYPKDNTPGCTTEGEDFRDRHEAFAAANVVIFGVSKDSLKSHQNFKAKFAFPFELITDKDETLCRLFDVIREKSMYGKTYLGVDRSTFLIDAEGVLRQEWRGVKVKGHADAVLEAARAL